MRTVGHQPSLWEAVLPEELRRLPEELARVDVLLDGPVFFAPLTPFFDPRIGRPSMPMETYLRLMFLKFRYRLGFESLCREVSDSITWRQFCRMRHRSADAASDHTDEADHPVRLGGGGGVERGPVGESGRGEGAAVQSDPGRHHCGALERGIPNRLRAVGEGGEPDRRHRPTNPRRRWRGPHQAPRPVPCRGASGP